VDQRSLTTASFDYPALIKYSDGSFSFAPEKPDSTQQAEIKAVEAYELSRYYSNEETRSSSADENRIKQAHWLFGPMKSFWRSYINVAIAAGFINMLALSSPIFIMNVYDRILPNSATSSLIALAIGVGLAILFDLLLKTARASIIDKTGRDLDRKVSYALFDKILFGKLSDRPESTGEYASRINQIDFVREFFTSNTISTLIDAAFVFVFLWVIYFIAGWLFIIPAIAFAIAIVLGLIAQYRIGKRVARAANESAQRQSLLIESLSTIETIKSLRAESQLLKKWSILTHSASHTSEDIKRLSANAANTTQTVQQLVTVFIVIAGAYEFSQGNITTGAIIACVMLSGRTVAPLTQIATTLARMRQAKLSLSILDSIMAQDEDRPSSTGFVNRKVNSGDFIFQDVSFQYPHSDAKVLNEISLSVRAGERVGIIGKIGSGKTTMGRLLAGLYHPTSGRILVNGVDVKQYHPAEIRKAVSYAGQSVDLFNGTLKENLLIADPDASDDQIIAAAAKTGVDEFAKQHPRGYDLIVGERGTSLSGGQQQSVAITRLLLGDPKIVFLDEPSGALDMATERQLIGNLSHAFGPETTLIISTHRYSLLNLVDRLIVLDRGKIVADGPKEKVLEAMTERAKAAQNGDSSASSG
jgi:ATP-binding cassette subfamily C protein LapB